MMINVCFVCLGNICRSPMAEAIMRHEIEKRGWQHQVAVDSHATGNWNEGQAPHHGTQKILTQAGVSFDKQIATVLTYENSLQFDYLIGMNDSNLKDMREIVGLGAELYQLLDFTETPGEIPDPYFTGDFEETYALITKGLEGFCAHLKAMHDLP